MLFTANTQSIKANFSFHLYNWSFIHRNLINRIISVPLYLSLDCHAWRSSCLRNFSFVSDYRKRVRVSRLMPTFHEWGFHQVWNVWRVLGPQYQLHIGPQSQNLPHECWKQIISHNFFLASGYNLCYSLSCRVLNTLYSPWNKILDTRIYSLHAKFLLFFNHI